MEETGLILPANSLYLVGTDGMASVMYPGTWAVTVFFSGLLPAGQKLIAAEPEKSGPWEFFDPLRLPKLHEGYIQAIANALGFP